MSASAKPRKRSARISELQAGRVALAQLRIHQVQLEVQNEELRQIQANLELLRARYFDLYDLAPAGYITIDNNDTVTECNLRAATLLGVTHSALMRRRFGDKVAQLDANSYKRSISELVRSGETQVCELRLQRLTGPPFWVRLE